MICYGEYWVIVCAIYCINTGTDVFSSSFTSKTFTTRLTDVHSGFDDDESTSCELLRKDIKCYENVSFVVNVRRHGRSENYEHGFEISFAAFDKQFELVLIAEKGHKHSYVSYDSKRSIFHHNMTITLVDHSGRRLVNYNTKRYVSGYLINDPSSIFHGTYHDGVLDGVIYTAFDSYYVEPMQKYFNTSTIRKDKQMLVVYREKDVVWFSPNATGGQYDSSNKPFEESTSGRHGGDYTINKRDGNNARVLRTVLRRRRDRLTKHPVKHRVCELSVVVDHFFYRFACGGSLARTIDRVTFAVRAADENFRRVDFNSDNVADDIGFVIKDVLIYTQGNTPGYRIGRSTDANEVLSNFAYYNFSSSCLGILFTHREFDKEILGLAFTASASAHGSPGGICYSKRHHVAGGWKSLNTLIVTSGNYLVHLPWRTVALTLSHELGHSFGSQHDGAQECLPGGIYGMYLMHPSATDYRKPNSYIFSPCSIRKMSPVVHNKGTCLKEYTSNAYCGNFLLEEGESCDCGVEQKQCTAFDRCCVPPTAHEPGCRIRHEQGYICSPLVSPCCTDLCRVEKEARVCHTETDCARAAVCDSISVGCPDPVPLADGTLCAGGVRVCSGGECVGSRCELYGWVDCECVGVQDELCQFCCASRNASDCHPAHKRSDMDDLMAPIYRNEADSCGNLSGFCTKAHVCVIAYPKDFDNVYDAIFQRSADEELQDLMENGWFYGVLVVALLVVCVVFAKVVFRRDEAAGVTACRSAKIVTLWFIIKSQEITLAEELRRIELLYDDAILVVSLEQPIDFIDAVARMRIFFPNATTDVIIAAVLGSNCEEFAVRKLLSLGLPMKSLQ